MAGYYRMKEKLSARKSDGKRTLYAQYVPTETVRMDEILDDVKERTALTSADLKAALQICQDLIVRALRSGRNIELEGLGTFSVVLKHREVESAKEIRSESIHFRDVTFRTSPALKARMRGMDLLRLEEGKAKQLPAVEDRMRRAMDYLSEHEYITLGNYVAINSCSRITASRELRKLLEDGKLTRSHFSRTLIYKLPAEEA